MENSKESFFSRLLARKRGATVELAPDPHVDESQIPTTGKTLPQTLLVFTPEQESTMSELDRFILEKRIETIPRLVVGEFNFVPFEAGELQGGYFCKVFIRNGRDVGDELTLRELTLYLEDAQGEKVAGGHFTLPNFGVLKFGEARYWGFFWRKEDVIKPNADLSEFSVSFA